jgi:hypothetical protein
VQNNPVKPKLTIHLRGQEGNAYFLVEKARMALEQAGLIEASTELGARFSASAWTPSKLNYTYDDVKRLIELYCDVIWLD